MLAFVKTAALVVILFLIMALLSRMSAPELSLDVSVQHSVKKLIQKSQEADAQTSNSTHPVHHLVYSTTALNNLDAALLLANPKQCETLTGCAVNDLYNTMVQKQEAAAKALYALQQQRFAPLQPHAAHHQHVQQQQQQPQQPVHGHRVH